MERIIIDEENLNKIILREEKDGTGKIAVLGGIYAINEVSVDILKTLNKSKNIILALKNVMEEYDILYKELAEDVISFLKQLVKINVISEKMCNNFIEEICSYEG